MKDIRNSPEYNQWKNEVKHRDGNACRRCGFENNLHVHHIKPFKKYPEFAIELDNGLTLCGNCHSLLRGKEESTDLQTFLGDDASIGEQLKAMDGSFSNYLQRKLQSKTQRARDSAASALFAHLKVYPNSLGEMISLLIDVVDSENWSDESHTKRQAIKWLKTEASNPSQSTPNETSSSSPTPPNLVTPETTRPSVVRMSDGTEVPAKEYVRAALNKQRTYLNSEWHQIRPNASKQADTLASAETNTPAESPDLKIQTSKNAYQSQKIQTTAAMQAISRYEQRVEQQRVEQQRITEQERLRQENEKREAEEKWQQEIISKYGSLEAYERHQKTEALIEHIRGLGVISLMALPFTLLCIWADAPGGIIFVILFFGYVFVSGWRS